MLDFKKSRAAPEHHAELPPLYFGHKRPFSDFVEFYQLEGQAIGGGLRTANSSTTAVNTYYYDPESEKVCDCSMEVPDCPDGGTEAWLVVLGGFLTYVATFGYLNSFGTYQSYYTSEFLPDRSPSDIAWIGSIQLFFLFFGGMIFGPMFDIYGAKPLFIPGTLIYIASFMIQSVSTKYYQLMLCQGILFGIGDSMLFYPTISSVSHWFNEKRGLALGIVVAGSSLGGVAWPILIQYLIEHIGYAWAVRTSGFICLALLAPGVFLVRGRIPPTKAAQPDSGVGGDLIKDIFKDGRYSWFVVGTFFVFWGMFVPFYYLPDYGKSHGMSSEDANYLLAYLNAGSLVGRVLSGFLADKLGRFNISLSCAMVSAILLLALHKCTVPSTIIVFSTLYGLFSGGLISLQSACIAQITPNIFHVGLKIGLMMAACSLVALTGPPIAGIILTFNSKNAGETPSGEHVLKWEGLINFAGIIMLGGCVAVAWSRWKIQNKIFARV